MNQAHGQHGESPQGRMPFTWPVEWTANSPAAELWLPTYQKYAQNLYHEARDLSHSASQAVAYANVSKEYRGLRHNLGVRASS